MESALLIILWVLVWVGAVKLSAVVLSRAGLLEDKPPS